MGKLKGSWKSDKAWCQLWVEFHDSCPYFSSVTLPWFLLLLANLGNGWATEDSKADFFRYQHETYRAIEGPQSIICNQSVSCHMNPRLTTRTDPGGHLIPFSHLPHLDWGTENRTSHRCALYPHHTKALILNYKCCSTGCCLGRRCFLSLWLKTPKEEIICYTFPESQGVL